MFIHCGMKKTKGGISKQWNTIPQLAKAGNKNTQIIIQTESISTCLSQFLHRVLLLGYMESTTIKTRT